MANVNGNAYTQLTSPGLLGAGLTSAGTGNSAGGFESEMPDVLQFEYTVTTANPAVFTSANLVTAEGTGIVQAYGAGTFEGTPVSLGWAAGPFAYTVTTANPAVFTVANTGWEGPSALVQNGMGVIILGNAASQIGTVSTLPTGNPYNSPQASITQYYMVSVSGNTFQLATTVGGAGISGAAGTAITSYSDNYTVMIGYGGVPAGFSAFVEYYIYNVSGNTFNLVPTQTSTTGVSGASGSATTAGILSLHNENQRPPQVAFGVGSGTTYQGIRKNGWRVGIQDNQVIPSGSSTTPSSVSLDENPQTAWQNVPGATCQNTYVSALFAGGTFTGGWGPGKGGFASGDIVVYTEKEPTMHTNESNGKPETSTERKVRLGKELDALKAKAEPTQAEKDRKAVVEKALSELK
jgi:hypothetical protein